ncbi:hypothetical protein STEG23_031664, partial [Scotinomys teguina]
MYIYPKTNQVIIQIIVVKPGNVFYTIILFNDWSRKYNMTHIKKLKTNQNE